MSSMGLILYMSSSIVLPAIIRQWGVVMLTLERAFCETLARGYVNDRPIGQIHVCQTYFASVLPNTMTFSVSCRTANPTACLNATLMLRKGKRCHVFSHVFENIPNHQPNI